MRNLDQRRDMITFACFEDHSDDYMEETKKKKIEREGNGKEQ